MKKYIIDLCSFSVEAENEEGAKQKALAKLRTDKDLPVIENITLDEE